MPTMMESRILTNDMLRDGKLSWHEWEVLDLVPWALPPSEEAVYRAVDTAEEWVDALPDTIGFATGFDVSDAGAD